MKKKEQKKKRKKKRKETWCARGASWVVVGEEGGSWAILHHKCYLEILVICLISEIFIVFVCYLLKWRGKKEY